MSASILGILIVAISVFWLLGGVLLRFAGVRMVLAGGLLLGCRRERAHDLAADRGGVHMAAWAPPLTRPPDLIAFVREIKAAPWPSRSPHRRR